MKGDDLKATMQSLLECRRMLRSVVAVTESFLPLAKNDGTIENLKVVKDHVRAADSIVLAIYERGSAEAFDV
jgi:hypothetical protein